MTSPLDICFRRGFAGALLLALRLGAATVTGHVDLSDSRDSAVKKGKNFSGVVVWLEPVDAPAAYCPERMR